METFIHKPTGELVPTRNLYRYTGISNHGAECEIVGKADRDGWVLAKFISGKWINPLPVRVCAKLLVEIKHDI